MIRLRCCIRYLVKNERGATAIEYGLLAGLVAVVIIAAVTSLGVGIKSVFHAACLALNPVVNNTLNCAQ
jgi:pilus assembly protein Flp/PilA